MALASPTAVELPAFNRAPKPKRSVSFMHHGTVNTSTTDIDNSSDDSNTNTNTAGNNNGNVSRSSFRPGRRTGYVRKGPVQSDSDADSDDEEEEKDESEDGDEKSNGGGLGNGIAQQANVNANANGEISSFSPKWKPTHTTTTGAGIATVRPGQNYVRRAPVDSDTESDEEKKEDDKEPTRSTPTPPKSTTTSTTAAKDDDQSDNSDTDNESMRCNSGLVGGLVRPMAQTRISGPGQNYVRKAPVNSDTEDDDDYENDNNNKTRSSPTGAAVATNSPAPDGNGAIQNCLLNPALMATTHSRAPSYDAYLASLISVGNVNGSGSGVGALSSAMSSPLSAPVATSSPAVYNSNLNTPPSSSSSANLGMTNNNNSNTSLGGSTASSSTAAIAAASIANSMAIYQQQQQEMMMIMQQQQIQIATMQQQQQAYQLLVLQQQQQHQQQLQAIHSRAASANGSIHTIETTVLSKPFAVPSDSDDDVPLGEKQQQLPQLPALPQFTSSLLGSSSPTITAAHAATTITPASPNAQYAHYSPRLSVQQPPLLQHHRQLSTSSVHSLPGAVAYAAHLPISSSPLNPATSSALAAAPTLGHPVYGSGVGHQQTSQPRLSDFIEEEQERLLREQHLQATAAALGGTSVNTGGFTDNGVGGASLLTSSFPAGYRGSVASVMSSFQHPSNIDRGSMTSLHSTGSNGSGGSGGEGGRERSGSLTVSGHRPTPSRDSFIPPMQMQQQQQFLQQPPLHLIQQIHHQQQQQQQPHFLPYQPATLIHVEAKPPPPSAGLVGAISAMERDKKMAKAHGTNQLQFQHQQQQQAMMMNVEKERWLQEQRRLAWEAGQYPQQQQQQPLQYYQQQPMMMMQVPMQYQPAWNSADEEDDDRPLGAH
ncbi:hypothetical protein BGX33_010374 [Mortierella sp. NVP41]|nr:hypothetical protein BGX33_010374 [Mortierella sp. NVP41]